MRKLASPLALLAAMIAAGTAVPAAAQPFSGFRLEGLLGYSYDHNNRGSDGLLYGGALGYDLRLGRLVAGVDAEASDTTTRTCYDVDDRPDVGACSHGQRDLAVAARVGTLVTPRTLLYATAGYTNYEKRVTRFLGNDVIDQAQNNFNGARIGAGLEYAILPHAYVKAEYRYSNYDDGLIRHQILGGAGVRF